MPATLPAPCPHCSAAARPCAPVRASAPWDAAAFVRYTAALREAFAQPAEASVAQGSEVIFLVGLPRSGSTLIEQVLAAHSQVEGASELPYLNQVLLAESQRRGRPYPAWVHAATAQDWARLGQDYLRASAPWRQQRPVATDKLPDNWQSVGAIRAMLPGARISIAVAMRSRPAGLATSNCLPPVWRASATTSTAWRSTGRPAKPKATAGRNGPRRNFGFRVMRRW